MKKIFVNREALLSISLNSLKIGIVVLDKDSRIRFINNAARQILNITNEDNLYLSDILYNAWNEI